ncbi:MAG: hypothetical protein U0637_03180 [Phycisphaerales bacterium]
MGPSEKAFNQVRSILGKLDRNIDQLRTQRTTPASAVATPPPPQSISQDRMVPGSSAGAQPAPTRATSVYGRATPITPPQN